MHLGDEDASSGISGTLKHQDKRNKTEFQYAMKHSNTHLIKQALDMADKMILLAHKGEAEREDSGCGYLFGIILDLANKIKTLAIEEDAIHKRMSGRLINECQTPGKSTEPFA